METLITKKIIKSGFEIVTSIINCNVGLSYFNDKWNRSVDGEVKSEDGTKWTCNYFTIGQLNKGFDATFNSAQIEFNRDCEAFDIVLNVQVLKNGIELIEQSIIGSDYSTSENIGELLDYLTSDNLNVEQLINEAKSIILELNKEGKES